MEPPARPTAARLFDRVYLQRGHWFGITAQSPDEIVFAAMCRGAQLFRLFQNTRLST
jgi:hypothetical protein